MLTFDGIEYRNLQEQVLQNQSDIRYLLEEGGTLNQFGITVVGQVATIDELPDPKTYTGEFGDAYAVGTEPPYTLHIWTRQISGQTGSFWFNIGQFPAPSMVPGPIGPQGIKGDPGTRGSFWYSQTGAPTNTEGVNENDQALDGSTGNVYQFVNGNWELTGNIKGPQGIQGIQGIIGPVGPIGPRGPVGPVGPQGQFIEIVGTLANTEQLPDPASVPRYTAYLIPIVGTEHVYLIVGEGTTEKPLLWHDAGGFGGGTAVFIDGAQQNQLDLTNDVIAPSYSASTDSSVTLETNSVTFNNLEVSGKNPGGSFVTPTEADINLPIKASDNIEPKVVDNSLAFDVTQAFMDKIEADIAAATPPEVVINAPTTATNGQLTAEQLATLQENKGAYLFFNNEVFRLQDTQHIAGYLIYTHVGYENTTQKYIIKCITITINTRGWVLTSREVVNPAKFDNYLLKSGGVMTGELVAQGGISLGKKDASTHGAGKYPDALPYYLGIEDYSDGGRIFYRNADDVKNDLGINEKLSLSGGTLTGPITYPNQTITTRYTNVAGYYTDEYGNFIHNQTNNTDSWSIQGNAHSADSKALTVVWETGDTIIKGTVNAPAFRQSNTTKDYVDFVSGTGSNFGIKGRSGWIYSLPRLSLSGNTLTIED